MRAYVMLRNLQTLLGKPEIIGRIEIRLRDPELAVQVTERIERAFGYDAESWQETNANFLGLFAMQNMILRFVIGAILLVGGFGILAIQIMIVLQKQRDIAILRAMGFEARDIERMFLAQGVLIGAVGNLFGIGLGCVFMAGLARIHFRIPGSTDITYMAIDWSPLQFLLAGGVAMLAAMTAAFLPARRAAKVEPVDVLRGGT
jgi:lipoprotein-releasing system permease protein